MKFARLDLVTVAMAVLLPVCAYFGYFQHRISLLSKLGRTEAELQLQATDRHGTAGDISSVRNKIRKLRQRLTDFIGSIPGEDEAYTAVDAVLHNAKHADVNIELIRPGKLVEGKTLNCLPIKLTATADFAKLYDFLLRLERGRVMATVNKMELESELLAKKCTVKLELRIYFVKTSDENKQAKT